MPSSKKSKNGNNPYSKFDPHKKEFKDAERQLRAKKRVEKRERNEYLADIESGKYVNERSHTPPHAQKRYKREQFLNPTDETWDNELLGGKKRTKKMLKKRRRTKKRT